MVQEHGAGRATTVVFLGAGNITQWAYALPGELEGAGMTCGVSCPRHDSLLADLKAHDAAAARPADARTSRWRS